MITNVMITTPPDTPDLSLTESEPEPPQHGHLRILFHGHGQRPPRKRATVGRRPEMVRQDGKVTQCPQHQTDVHHVAHLACHQTPAAPALRVGAATTARAAPNRDRRHQARMAARPRACSRLWGRRHSGSCYFRLAWWSRRSYQEPLPPAGRRT